MKITKHADHTEQLCGIRAEDIHKWIDGYFDRENYENFLVYGKTPDYNPYDHRKFRHCREALPEALKEFSHKYTAEQITKVFECHIKDDYNDDLVLSSLSVQNRKKLQKSLLLINTLQSKLSFDFLGTDIS